MEGIEAALTETGGHAKATQLLSQNNVDTLSGVTKLGNLCSALKRVQRDITMVKKWSVRILVIMASCAV